MIDRRRFAQLIRKNFRSVQGIVWEFQQSANDDNAQFCSEYRARFLDFLLPLRGFALAVEKNYTNEGLFVAIALLHDYIGDIARFEVRYNFPHIPTDISKPIQGIDDDEALAYVLRECQKPISGGDPVNLPCGSNAVKGGQETVRMVNTPAWSASLAYADANKGGQETVRMEKMRAAWTTSFDVHNEELNRQSGLLWDEADKKFGSD